MKQANEFQKFLDRIYYIIVLSCQIKELSSATLSKLQV